MALVVNGQGKWGILPTPSDFISTWKTNNTGSSTATQIKLPLVSTGTYNFVVDWGDGTTSTITTWNAAATTHTYATAGTYTVKIKGICTGWQFNNGGDRLKILSVSSWGKFKLGTTQGSYFYGCANLNLSGVTDVLDLAGTTSLLQMFRGCTALTTIGRVGEWNTSNVIDFGNVFHQCSNFNGNLSNWNVSSGTYLGEMFSGAAKFTNGGDPGIGNWVLKTTGTVNLKFIFSSAVLFNHQINWNTVAVTDMAAAFWGATAFNNGLASGVAGTFNLNTSLFWRLDQMFNGATSFNCDISSWDVSGVSSFESMFQSASKFNNGGSSGIGSWTFKTTGTIIMLNMFYGASIFNQPLNGWNTQAVTNMNSMFFGATNFNNGLASGVAGTLSWNTAAVTITYAMFQSAVSFNCNIGSWNVSAVTNFGYMFQSATKFNNGGSDTIGNWTLKTTGTISMQQMFQGTNMFNQSLNGWNTQAVTNMQQMFNTNSGFNNGLASGVAGTLTWNTAAVTNMAYMFSSTGSFNCNVGSWNVSSVGSFLGMFNGSTKFNNGGSADIGNWTLKTTGTISMQQMFDGANTFNQNIGSWNTANVTDMNTMFRNTTAFNQNIGSWNVSNVTNFGNIMIGKTPATFSTTNLDAIYNGWSTRAVLASKSISFGTAKRTAASTAGRAILTNSPNLWTITDGGI